MKYGFADFSEQALYRVYLPKEYWLESDYIQFKYLNEQIKGEVEGYTWHHTEDPGWMELVPYGIHNMVPHNGGRSSGMWADAPR